MTRSPDHWSVLGVAQPRTVWYRELARWSSTAAAPIDATIAMTLEEALAHLATGRSYSALMIDGDHPGLDLDLLADARRRGCAALVVDAGLPGDWLGRGAAALLPAGFGVEDLLAALAAVATPVEDLRHLSADGPRRIEPDAHDGQLIAVTGPGGSGTSTVARALAQGLAATAPGSVVLADLALDADQAMAHHVGDVVPAVAELVDAHRRGSLDRASVRALTWSDERLSYRLLLGLRHHHDWASLREGAARRSLTALRAAFPTVVADIEPDLEDEGVTGSTDVAERNLLARLAVEVADLVLVTVHDDLRCLRRLGPLTERLGALGVAPARILPVVVGGPRRPDRRARLVATVAALTPTGPDGAGLQPPLFLPWRRDVRATVHDGVPLPDALARPLGSTAALVLARVGPRHALVGGPVPVAPGSLGGWWDAESAVGP